MSPEWASSSPSAATTVLAWAPGREASLRLAAAALGWEVEPFSDLPALLAAAASAGQAGVLRCDLPEVGAALVRLRAQRPDVPWVIWADAPHPLELTWIDCGAQDVVVGEADAVVRALRLAFHRCACALADGERRARSVLQASIDGVGGAEATLVDTATGMEHRVRSDNRAALLFLLGRQLVRDRAAGKDAQEAGWVADRDAVVGIWGRAGEPGGRNRLHVLVHRMRKELEEAGLDPELLESRRNGLRLRIGEVRLGAQSR